MSVPFIGLKSLPRTECSGVPFRIRSAPTTRHRAIGSYSCVVRPLAYHPFGPFVACWVYISLIHKKGIKLRTYLVTCPPMSALARRRCPRELGPAPRLPAQPVPDRGLPGRRRQSWFPSALSWVGVQSATRAHGCT